MFNRAESSGVKSPRLLSGKHLRRCRTRQRKVMTHAGWCLNTSLKLKSIRAHNLNAGVCFCIVKQQNTGWCLNTDQLLWEGNNAKNHYLCFCWRKVVQQAVRCYNAKVSNPSTIHFPNTNIIHHLKYKIFFFDWTKIFVVKLTFTPINTQEKSDLKPFSIVYSSTVWPQ